LNLVVGNVRFCEDFQDYKLLRAASKNKCILLGLFNNTTLNCAVLSRSATNTT